MKIWIGIDVSKAWLDVCIAPVSDLAREFRIANDAAGIAELPVRCRAAAPEGDLCFCMESTGGYELEAATFLCQSGFHVSVVNPARVKFFIRFKGWQNKTDLTDARAIACYARTESPDAWRLADPVRREIVQLRRHRERLTEDLLRVRNYLEHRSTLPSFIVEQHEELVQSLLAKLLATEAHLLELVRASTRTEKQLRALTTIIGVGTAFALAILCELGDYRDYDSAQQFAAAAGIAPCRNESGNQKKKARISKGGNQWVRNAGWMPAMVATRTNPTIQEFTRRLQEKGLAPKQIRIAALRKLLMHAYGVLKALDLGKLEPSEEKPIRFRPGKLVQQTINEGKATKEPRKTKGKAPSDKPKET